MAAPEKLGEVLDEEESKMANLKTAKFNAAIWLALGALLLTGCADVQVQKQEMVSPLYILTTAGFTRLDVNMNTPKTQALLNSIPYGKIMTYKRNGEVYHVYADKDFNALYVGDEVAYQKYLSMTHAKQLCERVDATDPLAFWSCFEEVQTGGPRPRGK